MERKRALAIAAAATATLGCAIVAGASIGGYSLLGFGSSHTQGPGTFGAALAAHQKSVTKYREVYDKYVVDTAPSRESAGADDGVAPALAPTVDPAPGDDAAPSPHESSGGSESSNASGDDNEAEPTNIAPTPPTSAPSSPPTTSLQPVEIPDDWPADKPLPPMPADCHEPHLEDNGVWNCGDDD